MSKGIATLPDMASLQSIDHIPTCIEEKRSTYEGEHTEQDKTRQDKIIENAERLRDGWMYSIA